MGDVKNGYQATPNATLEQQMMDACAPKNEREWWAFAEIGRLRAEVEALKLQRTAADIVGRETANIVLLQVGEVERLRAALENVRLLAARHRKEEWAGHMLRFCADAGVTGSPLREGGK